MKSDSTVFTNVFLCLFTLEVISYGMSESSASLTDALTYDILGEDKKGKAEMPWPLTHWEVADGV